MDGQILQPTRRDTNTGWIVVLVIAIVGVCALTLAAATSGQPAPPGLPVPVVDGFPTFNGHEGPWLFFLGTLVTTLVNLYIQARNRKWSIDERERNRRFDAEDRARIATDLAQQQRHTAEDLKRTTEGEAARVQRTSHEIAAHLLRIVETKHAVLNEKIDQNTQVNEQALVASNDINAKILHVSDLMATVATTGGRRAADQAREELSILETALAEHHGAEPREPTR